MAKELTISIPDTTYLALLAAFKDEAGVVRNLIASANIAALSVMSVTLLEPDLPTQRKPKE